LYCQQNPLRHNHRLINTSLQESVGKIESLRTDSVISVSLCWDLLRKRIHHRGTENTEKLFPTDTFSEVTTEPLGPPITTVRIFTGWGLANPTLLHLQTNGASYLPFQNLAYFGFYFRYSGY